MADPNDPKAARSAAMTAILAGVDLSEEQKRVLEGKLGELIKGIESQLQDAHHKNILMRDKGALKQVAADALTRPGAAKDLSIFDLESVGARMANELVSLFSTNKSLIENKKEVADIFNRAIDGSETKSVTQDDAKSGFRK